MIPFLHSGLDRATIRMLHRTHRTVHEALVPIHLTRCVHGLAGSQRRPSGPNRSGGQRELHQNLPGRGRRRPERIPFRDSFHHGAGRAAAGAHQRLVEQQTQKSAFGQPIHLPVHPQNQEQRLGGDLHSVGTHRQH